jgi:D-3-phosphoglycerate dehydrogenase
MPAIMTRVVTVSGMQTVSGALFGVNGDGRITEINGFHIEAIPVGHMVVMRNRDVPGVIGRVGTILGVHGINISRFHLGRRERGGEAMAVIETDAPLDDTTLNELQSFEPVVSARRILLET